MNEPKPSDPSADRAAAASDSAETPPPVASRKLFVNEDWCSIGIGAAILLLAGLAVWLARPADQAQLAAQLQIVESALDSARRETSPDAEVIAELADEREQLGKQLAKNPLAPYVAKIGSWNQDPSAAFFKEQKKPAPPGVKPQTQSILPGVVGVFVLCLVLFSIGTAGLGEHPARFVAAFVFVFLLAVLAFVLAGQKVVKHYNLEYALWALLIGLVISNTIGTPRFWKPAVRTEFYIKTGLVLLGAEILFHKLLALGLPGIFVAWVVTPIVLISTFAFGQRVLRMSSPSLNMVISADMSVCGVSAAIATGAACRAKREELSLAIALSLGFTVIMMIVMPIVIRSTGMSEVLGGAWIGGTIDSTGAVAAAGGMLGETALAVATTVKMIQNILIGVIAFGVSVYWVGWIERGSQQERISLWEIWRRFPKFMLGFVAASLVASAISYSGPIGAATVSAVLGGTSETVRGWLFCLAFVSIGLETNFRTLLPYFRGGKPLILYLVGQTLNLALTLFMAWLMFEKVFPDAARALGP